jgi:hypothetical protein
MVIISPRPYLIGIDNLALTAPRQYFVRTIPQGANWRFKYMTVNYLRTVAATVQTSPDLLFKAYDADGRCFQVSPVLFAQVTTPSGGRAIAGTNAVNIDYPGGTNIKLEIEGAVGGVPNSISITLFGIRGWEGYGK